MTVIVFVIKSFWNTPNCCSVLLFSSAVKMCLGNDVINASRSLSAPDVWLATKFSTSLSVADVSNSWTSVPPPIRRIYKNNVTLNSIAKVFKESKNVTAKTQGNCKGGLKIFDLAFQDNQQYKANIHNYEALRQRIVHSILNTVLCSSVVHREE